MSKTRILEAVRRLDLEGTRALLARDPSLVAVTEPDGRNLLHLACSASCERLRVSESAAARLVRLLLDRGLDVESTRMVEGYPCNSVWCAVARGRNPTLVRLLVRRGATPRGLFAAGWNGDLPLLRLLVRLGAVVDEEAEGETPFLFCFRTRRFAAAKVLLQSGADVDFRGAKGKTALHYAVERDFEPRWIALLLRSGASPDVEDRDGVTPRARAARKRDRSAHEAIARARPPASRAGLTPRSTSRSRAGSATPSARRAPRSRR